MRLFRLVIIIFIFFNINISLFSETIRLEKGWKFKVEGSNEYLPIEIGKALVDQGYSVPIVGTYQFKLSFDKIPDYSYAINLDRIQSADEAFWNGMVIGRTGRFSPNYYSYWHRVRYYEIPLSKLLPGENILEIKIECREKEFRCGIFRSVPIFGSQDEIKDRMIYEDVGQILMAALFFGIFLQQGIGYALNRSSKSGLYLALTAIFFVGWRIPALNKIHFIGFNPEILVRLLFFCQFLFPVFLLLFAHSLFDRRISKLAVITFLLDTILAVFQLFEMSPDFRFYLVYFWYLLLGIKVPILVLLLFRNYARSMEAIVVSVGALVATIFGLMDVVTDFVTGQNAYLTQYGIIVFLFSGVFAIALQSARTKRELRNLNESLEMIVILRTQELEKQYKILNDDLLIAAGLQSKLIPPMHFKHKSLSVDSTFLPMEKIGGDYFDYYIHEDGSITFLLCDVLGHGIAAALIASMLKVNFYEQAPKKKDPAELLIELNQKMLPVVEKNYITAVCCNFEFNQNILKHAIMGHPSPIYLNSKTGAVETLVGKGPILGWRENISLESIHTFFSPGDRFFFYTDGVTEAQSNNKELFGEKRLVSILESLHGEPVEKVNTAVLSEVKKFSNRLSDDVTYFVVDIHEQAS